MRLVFFYLDNGFFGDVYFFNYKILSPGGYIGWVEAVTSLFLRSYEFSYLCYKSSWKP